MPSASHVASKPIITARSIDDVRPLKVIAIGAGISGILAAIRLPQRVKNLDLVIYDKNEEIGGTWFENVYPGIACGRVAEQWFHEGILRVLTACRYTRTLLPVVIRVKCLMVDFLCSWAGDSPVLEEDCGEVRS